MQENKKLSENNILNKFSFFIKKKISKIFHAKKAKFTFLYLTMYNFFRMSYYDTDRLDSSLASLGISDSDYEEVIKKF